MRGSSVRSLVSIVVVIATVMHLTFGCCLHASHFCADDHDCCAEHDAAPTGDSHHDCSGCTCAATVEGDLDDLPQSPALPLMKLWVTEPLPATGCGKGRPKDRGGPPLSHASHPLHERLLV
jgi:hypothetical protein